MKRNIFKVFKMTHSREIIVSLCISSKVIIVRNYTQWKFLMFESNLFSTRLQLKHLPIHPVQRSTLLSSQRQ